MFQSAPASLFPSAARQLSTATDRAWPHDGALLDWILELVYQHRRWLYAAVLATYLAGFNGQWRIEPDAALYLTLGRNLAEGRGYTYLWKTHHLAYPGLPWLIAGTFKVFGANQVWPAHLAMLLIAFATLALVYRLFLLHSGNKIAVMMTLGVAVTKTFYRYAFEMRSDMPFLFGVMAFLAGYEAIFARQNARDGQPQYHPRWYDWGLMLLGLVAATVTRPTIWLLLMAIAISVGYAAVRGRMRIRIILVLALIVFGLAFTFHQLDPRRSAQGTDDYQTTAIVALTSGLSGTLHNIVHQNLPELLLRATPDSLMQVRLGWFNAVLSFLFIGIGVALVRERVLWGVFFTLIVAMNLGFLALDRYYLPVLPLMTYGWWFAMRGLNRRLPGRGGMLVVASLLAMGLGSNLDKIGGIIVQQRATPFLARYEHGLYQPLAALAPRINAAVDEHSLVLIPHAYGRIMTFLSHRYAADYRDFPDINLNAQAVYVVQPMDPQTQALVAANHLKLGEEVAAVSRKDGTPLWTLCKTIPDAP